MTLFCVSLDRFRPFRRSRSCSRTRRQAINPISSLVELRSCLDCWINICCISHVILHVKLLHPLYCSSVQHSHSRGNGWCYRLSQGNGGKLLQLCVSHLRGFVWFFPLRRGEERRTSSYDPRSWGHLPKELFASCPSVKYGWRRPPGLRRLGADSSVVLLPRLLTPRRDNPRVEWMLSHFFMSAFRFIPLR